MKHPRPGLLDRRGLLAGLASLAALPASAAVILVDPAPPEPAPPFAAGRPAQLRPWQVAALEDIGGSLRRKLHGSGVECGLMDDHYRVRIPWNLLFASPARTALTPDGVRLATLVAEVMVLKRRWTMQVNGHAADLAQGYDAYIISARQAEAFRAAMISRTVPGQLLRATGLGDNFPVRPLYPTNSRLELLVELA